MYGDFPAKNTVYTPYIPVNVWLWPILVGSMQRSHAFGLQRASGLILSRGRAFGLQRRVYPASFLHVRSGAAVHLRKRSLFLIRRDKRVYGTQAAPVSFEP
jgi:hypothetical protein